MMNEPVLWLKLVDGLAGLMMWLLVLRSVISIMLPDNHRSRPVNGLKRLTDPFLRITGYVKPKLLVDRLHGFYAAFWVFILRFYALPAATGYEVASFADLPLETLLTGLLSALSSYF